MSQIPLSMVLPRLAVRVAERELGLHVREVDLQNRGPRVDVYLRNAGVDEGTIRSSAPSAADARMWCGMLVYFCYTEAARQLGVALPFEGRHLWSGQRLVAWARSGREHVVTDGVVQEGDVFSLPSGHIGIASGPNAAPNGLFPTIEGNQGEVGSRWDGIARKTSAPGRCVVIVRPRRRSPGEGPART